MFKNMRLVILAQVNLDTRKDFKSSGIEFLYEK